MTRLTTFLTLSALGLASTSALAGPLPFEVAGRAPLDVPPAYLDRGAVGPDLTPGASSYAVGCQFVRRELMDERGEIRVFRVPACL